MSRRILVVGATGKQGRALISHLSTPSPDHESESFQILALTRTPSSQASQSLTLINQSISLLKADLNSPSSIRKIFTDLGGKGSIYGVFVALQFPGLGANADAELAQGIAIADLANEFQVQRFIFSSLERGSESYDQYLTLDRASKRDIERHIISLPNLPWTILRPGFFMENLSGTLGRITTSVLLAGLNPSTQIPLVAVDDIGRVSSQILTVPSPSLPCDELTNECEQSSSPKYTHAKIPIISSLRTPSQMLQSHLSATSTPQPQIPLFLARLLIHLNTHTKNLIDDINRIHTTISSPQSKWGEGGWTCYLSKNAYDFVPENEMTSYEDWARERQKKKDGGGEWGGWNGVRIWDLVRGRR
ncbi:NAD(P)-binding protein [Sistotremastrum niveocremeum HHB9708]|uniref:NAD(P)-binding protein n=1 Tax=Sistotremastrum niveocremeum HHB9708 TaxID=1314777 RepID=A0A164Q7B2_9AGAM|nr:NAD(P)-binding protein [Sistotremastrum niveocremeum HHB9708]